MAERTEAIYEVALRCHLKPALGTLLICAIDASRIASYQVRRKAEKASARTLNKELQVLRQILKRHKLRANLQGDIKFEREHSEIGRALTREKEKRLFAACGSNSLLNAVVTSALNTALRKNEIRTLRWSLVDFEKLTITVGRAKTQAGSGRSIPLNQPAFDALVKWAGRLRDRRVRTSNEVQAMPDAFNQRCPVTKQAAPTARRSGQSKTTTGLNLNRRRLPASKQKLQKFLVVSYDDDQQQWVGHTSLKMTSKYTHFSAKHRKEVVAKLGAIAS